MSEVLPVVKTEPSTTETSAQPNDQSPSPLSSDQLIDRLFASSDDVIALISAMRNESNDQKRALLAAKINGVWDHDLRECFLANGGLAVITNWLDVTSTNGVVLAVLEALAVLPLTKSAIQSANELPTRLMILKTHSNEVIAQLADDLSADCRKKLASNDADESIDNNQPLAGHIRHIKIDKTSPHMHAHQLMEHKLDPSEIVKDVVFESIPVLEPMPALEGPADPSINQPAKSTSQLISPTNNQTKHGRSRSVSWVDESSLETVRVYFPDETVDRTHLQSMNQPNNQSSNQPTTPLKPTVTWYPPGKLWLPSINQSISQARGTESTERHLQLERESKCPRQSSDQRTDPLPVDTTTNKAIILPTTNVPIPFNAKSLDSTNQASNQSNSVSAIVATLNNVASTIGAQTKAPIKPSTTISQSLQSINQLINHLAAPEQKTNIKKEPKKKKQRTDKSDNYPNSTDMDQTGDGQPLVVFAPKSAAAAAAIANAASKAKQAQQPQSRDFKPARSPLNGPSKSSPPLPKSISNKRLSGSSPKHAFPNVKRGPEPFGVRTVQSIVPSSFGQSMSQSSYASPRSFGQHSTKFSPSHVNQSIKFSPSPPQNYSSPMSTYPQAQPITTAYVETDYTAPVYNQANYQVPSTGQPSYPPAPERQERPSRWSAAPPVETQANSYPPSAPTYTVAAPRYQRQPAPPQQYSDPQYASYQQPAPQPVGQPINQPAYSQAPPPAPGYTEQYYEQYEQPGTTYQEAYQGSYDYDQPGSYQYEQSYEAVPAQPNNYAPVYTQPAPPPQRVVRPAVIQRPGPRFAPPPPARPPQQGPQFANFQVTRVAQPEAPAPYYPPEPTGAPFYPGAQPQQQQYEQPVYEDPYVSYQAPQPYETYSEYSDAPVQQYAAPSQSQPQYHQGAQQYATEGYAPQTQQPLYSQPAPVYAAGPGGQKRRRDPMYAGAGPQPASRQRTGP